MGMKAASVGVNGAGLLAATGSAAGRCAAASESAAGRFTGWGVGPPRPCRAAIIVISNTPSPRCPRLMLPLLLSSESAPQPVRHRCAAAAISHKSAPVPSASGPSLVG